MAWVGMLFFLLYVGCTQANLIPLTPGWAASASSYANYSYSFSNGEFYPLLTPNETTVTSYKSTFVLGLFSSDGSPTVTLIICLLPFNSSLVIDVWNFGSQIIQNGPVLRLSPDKSQLQHVDANFNVIWSSPAGASALQLTESGNLIVYNSSHHIIWQSFDHPTDTFLPGQNIKQGMYFTSSNSSYPAAEYSYFLAPSGLVLYSISGGSPLPYSALAIDGTLDYNKAIQECGGLSNSPSTLYYDATHTADYLVLQACGKSSKYTLAFQQQSKFRFIRLDSDANVRHYLWQNGNLTINIEFFGKNKRCTFPDICGSYGVCSGEGECNCPLQNSSSSLEDAFTFDSKTGGCRLPTALSCDADRMENQIFLTLSNVTYFSNRYVAPLKFTKKDQCLSSCLSNCSCLVAFYEDSPNLSARACYHIFNHVSSLQQISSDAQKHYLAYLKVQQNLKVQPSSHSSISTTVIVIISVAAAILAASIGFFTWFYFKKSKKEEKSSSFNEPSDDFLILMPGVPHKFSLKELEDATGGFQNKLGEGGFGAVFSGKLKDGRIVAVKRLEGATQGQKEFEAEVRTLGGIDHINLVRLYGFCIEGANRLLVYEWMSNGSLDQWLFVEDSDIKELPWTSRMAIAMDIAQGLAYLHEGCSQPVLHLDIKPQNILLGEKFKAKVSDLGMARLINQDVITMTIDKTASYLHNNSTFQITQARGTPGYLAPELFGDLIVGKKSDVYSYGIVLLQIISGKKVYGSFETGFLPSWVYMKVVSGNITEIVDPKLDGNFEHHQAEQVIRLACWCIHEIAEQRPAMSQIIQMLQGKMEVPEPTLAEPHPIMKPPRNTNSDFTMISGGDPSSDILVPR